MTLAEAIAHLEHQALIKLELSRAPRHGAGAREAGAKMLKDATAIAMVLAALPEGAR